MTNFTRQPDVLPAVLPAGTKFKSCTATAEMRLVNGYYYVNGCTTYYGWAPREVDWSSVPTPPKTKAPKLCTACGAKNASGHWTLDSETYRDVLGSRLCGSCSFTRPALETANAIRARRSQLTATPDRPIQAGDWVVCVDAQGSNLLELGKRYVVEYLDTLNNGWFGLVGVSATSYTPSRFKRVDGPHPAKHAHDPAHWFDCKICDQPTERVFEHQVVAGTVVERGFCPACFPIAQRQAEKDSSVPVGTGNAQSSGTGGTEPECANGAHYFSAGDDICVHCGIWRLHTYEHAHGPSHCSECKAPAPLLASGKCEYCDKRKLCDVRIAGLTDDSPRMVEPRQRLAAIERKERPRVTRESRMLAAGHPASWPSNEGEE